MAVDLWAFTPRELEILALLKTSASIKEIANKFGVKQKSITAYLTNIYAKLGYETSFKPKNMRARKDLAGVDVRGFIERLSRK